MVFFGRANRDAQAIFAADDARAIPNNNFSIEQGHKYFGGPLHPHQQKVGFRGKYCFDQWQGLQATCQCGALFAQKVYESHLRFGLGQGRQGRLLRDFVKVVRRLNSIEHADQLGMRVCGSQPKGGHAPRFRKCLENDQARVLGQPGQPTAFGAKINVGFVKHYHTGKVSQQGRHGLLIKQVARGVIGRTKK